MSKGSFLKRLLSVIKCSNCDYSYQTEDVSVLGQQGDLWFVSVACPSCGIQGLVAAVVEGSSPRELVTDFSEDEYAKFVQSEAIGINDVLDMHNFLKDFDGDISKLLIEK